MSPEDCDYTNECTCTVYDIETDETRPASDCFGECWLDQVERFTEATRHLFTSDLQPFRIEGFPTWHGPVNGTAEVRNAEQLLRAMTPSRTGWRLTLGAIFPDRFTATLYHHDAPTGGTMTVTPFEPID